MTPSLFPFAACGRCAGWLASTVCLLAAEPAPTPPAGSTDVPPRVVRVAGALQLDRDFTVEVAGLKPWVSAGNQAHKLLLFLEGRASLGDYPEAVDLEAETLQYHLEITPENRRLWEDLLDQPTFHRRVAVSVGLDPDAPFPTVVTGPKAASLHIVAFPWGLFSLIVVGLTLAALLRLGRDTDLLRDAGPPSTPARRKPYSLARTQMAVWFYLVFSAYVVIWLVTGDLNTVTQSLLGLMGISAGTALGGALLDTQKRDAAAAQLARVNPDAPSPPPPEIPDPTNPAPVPAPPTSPAPSATAPLRQALDQLDPGVSQGFLRDLLSDGQGISLHRFQIAAWTVALGVIFVAETYNTLRMPEFSATLLGLMGISAGTYLGFKVPEK